MKTLSEFQSMVSRLPLRLQSLVDCPPMLRNGLGDIPKRGIYAFYEHGQPVYVGRSSNMKQRLMSHGRPSSGHMTATFAFLLAMDDAKSHGIDTSLTREQLQRDPAFGRTYMEAKKRVGAMQIRVVGITDPIEQTVFEPYAALALNTPYNSFENH